MLVGWVHHHPQNENLLALVDSRYHLCLDDMCPKISNYKPCVIAQEPGQYSMVRQFRVIHDVDKFYSENIFETVLIFIFLRQSIKGSGPDQ